MKRFYCKQCQRVKRVRKLPPSVTSDFVHPVLKFPVGRCLYHDGIFPGRHPKTGPMVKPTKQPVAASSAPVKRGRKGA